MNQLRSLILDRLNDFRMTMSGRADGDSGVAVEQDVAINVCDPDTFAAFSDQLYTPPWSCEWYVKEARTHGIDGVVHLVSDDPRGSYFTTRALEQAGFPVIELRADNVDARGYSVDDASATIETWLESDVQGRDPY